MKKNLLIFIFSLFALFHFSTTANCQSITNTPIPGFYSLTPSNFITPVLPSPSGPKHLGPTQFYGGSVTTGAAAGFILIFDGQTIPSPGTVSPHLCYAVTANSTIGLILPGNTPVSFPNSFTVVMSVGTACWSYTADSAQDFFFVEAQ
jgi:hypothetical protein